MSFPKSITFALKSIFYDGGATVSITRVLMAVVALNVWSLIWFCVAWVIWVTHTHQMVEAAPLAAAVATGLGTVMSSTVIGTAWQYYTQMKHGSGGATAVQLDEEQRGIVPPPNVPPAQVTPDVQVDATVTNVEASDGN